MLLDKPLVRPILPVRSDPARSGFAIRTCQNFGACHSPGNAHQFSTQAWLEGHPGLMHTPFWGHSGPFALVRVALRDIHSVQSQVEQESVASASVPHRRVASPAFLTVWVPPISTLWFAWTLPQPDHRPSGALPDSDPGGLAASPCLLLNEAYDHHTLI